MAHRPDPPEGADRYEVARQEITVPPWTVRDLGLCEDLGIDPSDHKGRPSAITLKTGDEIPAPLAERIYPAFYNRIAVFDETGDRIDAGTFGWTGIATRG